jgi:hypothetical protein
MNLFKLFFEILIGIPNITCILSIQPELRRMEAKTMRSTFGDISVLLFNNLVHDIFCNNLIRQ